MNYRRAHQPGDPPPVGAALYWRDDIRAAVGVHDFATLYRALKHEEGLGQRRIADLTGQKQAEVSEILNGRRVLAYAVLRRIVDGLGIPPELAHLSSYGPDGTYAGEVTVAEPSEGVNAAMLRRHLIALGGVTIAGATVKNLGELLGELPGLSPIPLPTRVDWVHVAQVRDLKQWLFKATMTYGSDPSVSSAAAEEAARLLRMPGPEPVKDALMAAVAGLHLETGWSAFDAGLYERAMYHYARGLELATDAGDSYVQVLALNLAGLATIEHGHPDDGLKMLQYGQVKSWDIAPDNDRDPVAREYSRVAVQACGLADSATALTMLGAPEAAYREQGKARELWHPTRTDPAGDLDRPAALLELDRGRLDTAEQFAAASVRRWEGVSEPARTKSCVVLATIHVQAGEPGGPGLAHDAITRVGKLRSVRARKLLLPLADALEARPGGDCRGLARSAREVATTGPEPPVRSHQCSAPRRSTRVPLARAGGGPSGVAVRPAVTE